MNRKAESSGFRYWDLLILLVVSVLWLAAIAFLLMALGFDIFEWAGDQVGGDQ